MRFVFVLLALIVLSPVLIASPCTAATPGLTLDAQLSSYSPGATDVHYEYRYDGYSAELVPDPFIIYSGDTAVVTIIVSDIDDPTRQGAPPTTPFCTGGYVGFGVLRPGTYTVSIRLLFFVNSSNLGYRNGPSSTFTWTIPPRCTATSTFTVEPLTPGIDSTITLRSSRLIAAWYGVTTTTISGHTITVTDEINNEVPTTYRLDVKLRAAGRRPASSGAPLAAHPIMPVQVARRRANSRRGSRLGRREQRGRTVNFNAELGG